MHYDNNDILMQRAGTVERINQSTNMKLISCIF